MKELQQMKRFNFYAKSGDAVPFKFQTTAKLKESKYQLSRKESKQLDKFLVHQSGYYRPIQTEELTQKENLEIVEDKQKTNGIPNPKI